MRRPSGDRRPDLRQQPHRVELRPDGSLARVKIVDPSFFNWPALSYALEDNIVPDFPLCNKSFNKSYSGNDL